MIQLYLKGGYKFFIIIPNFSKVKLLRVPSQATEADQSKHSELLGLVTNNTPTAVSNKKIASKK